MPITTQLESDLAHKSCHAIEAGTQPMNETTVKEYLQQLDDWSYQGGQISKMFGFKNYYETTAFVNAVVWIAHHEDHHPTIEFGYKNCKVSYSTHSVGGISENDFICAAKVDTLL